MKLLSGDYVIDEELSLFANIKGRKFYPQSNLQLSQMAGGIRIQDDFATIRDTAMELKKLKTRFFTGHCTGERAIELMKPIMQEQLVQIHSGDVWEI